MNAIFAVTLETPRVRLVKLRIWDQKLLSVNMVPWLESYLTGKSQKVWFNSVFSLTRAPFCSVYLLMVYVLVLVMLKLSCTQMILKFVLYYSRLWKRYYCRLICVRWPLDARSMALCHIYKIVRRCRFRGARWYLPIIT